MDHFRIWPECPAFFVPISAQPAWYCRNNFASVCGTGDEGQDVKFAKGTTTLAFKFQGGVIVSVDSRSTMGAYISSGTVKKVIEINPFLFRKNTISFFQREGVLLEVGVANDGIVIKDDIMAALNEVLL